MLAEIFSAVSRTASAGLRAYAAQQQTPKKRRKNRKKGGCTPCAALKDAERIQERASEGRL